MRYVGLQTAFYGPGIILQFSVLNNMCLPFDYYLYETHIILIHYFLFITRFVDNKKRHVFNVLIISN